jgi:hypothetical protein
MPESRKKSGTSVNSESNPHQNMLDTLDFQKVVAYYKNRVHAKIQYLDKRRFVSVRIFRIF